MKDIIVVATSPGREDWAKDCSESIKRPHIVISDYGYELGKIKWAYENLNFDRIVFLQDSVMITDPTIFDRIHETNGSICLHHEARDMSCYLGVYEKSILSKIEIPVITTKGESINYESAWVSPYLEAVENMVCFDNNANGKFGETVEKNGRSNLIYSNNFLIKYRAN